MGSIDRRKSGGILIEDPPRALCLVPRSLPFARSRLLLRLAVSEPRPTAPESRSSKGLARKRRPSAVFSRRAVDRKGSQQQAKAKTWIEGRPQHAPACPACGCGAPLPRGALGAVRTDRVDDVARRSLERLNNDPMIITYMCPHVFPPSQPANPHALAGTPTQNHKQVHARCVQQPRPRSRGRQQQGGI